jgi:hypothetical protein
MSRAEGFFAEPSTLPAVWPSQPQPVREYTEGDKVHVANYVVRYDAKHSELIATRDDGEVFSELELRERWGEFAVDEWVMAWREEHDPRLTAEDRYWDALDRHVDAVKEGRL